jgi:hypothetical protein
MRCELKNLGGNSHCVRCFHCGVLFYRPFVRQGFSYVGFAVSCPFSCEVEDRCLFCNQPLKSWRERR